MGLQERDGLIRAPPLLVIRCSTNGRPRFLGFYNCYSSRRYIRSAPRAFLDFFSGSTDPLSLTTRAGS